MNQKEIIDVFSEYGEKCTMFKDDPDSVMEGMFKCALLEIKIELKDGTNLLVMLGEESYVDITNSNENDYVGFGSTLIDPMSNIKSIEAKWRGIDKHVTNGVASE